jgi:hypothetical protein
MNMECTIEVIIQVGKSPVLVFGRFFYVINIIFGLLRCWFGAPIRSFDLLLLLAPGKFFIYFFFVHFLGKFSLRLFYKRFYEKFASNNSHRQCNNMYHGIKLTSWNGK